MHRRVPGIFLAALVVGAVARPVPANAHVKWFAPFAVDASPRPLGDMLGNSWFWLAVALAMFFFLAARIVEQHHLGQALLDRMDAVAAPLWTRADGFVRATAAAFFVAIFARGGIYLTPDLVTKREWVSWVQLMIAAGLFWRRTMPLSAVAILALWGVALEEYDLFHLLDYLALGVGFAGYLVGLSFPNSRWHGHRFAILRWAVAIALMRSSLEKFAYPDWFYPLAEEMPFLTLGIPVDIFLPMAGVTELVLGLGLVWTPLVRRLSAIVLFCIFNAAVLPFGRVDLIGHGLILTMLVVVAIDPTREVKMLPEVRRSLLGIPCAFVAAVAVFATSYWGWHAVRYTAEDAHAHTHSLEHRHGRS
jgi:hypothetical protein